jgi:hypothetical protein
MDFRILSPTSTERLLDRLEKLTGTASTAPSTTSTPVAVNGKPRRKIRKRKDKATHSSSKSRADASIDHQRRHHHHHHHRQQPAPAQPQLHTHHHHHHNHNHNHNRTPLGDKENDVPRLPATKQKSMVRLSAVRPMRNEAMFARTPDVASESIDERPKPKQQQQLKAVVFASTPLGSKHYQASCDAAAAAAVDAVVDDNDEDEQEDVVVVTDSKINSRSGSNISASRSGATTAGADADESNNGDADDADDAEDDDGYATTLLHLAFAGMDNARGTKRAPSKKRERAAGVTLPSSTPTIAITPAIVTASAPAAPPADAGEAPKVVTVSLAAYSAMQTEANELRAQVAALQKQVASQTTTIETMSATMLEMQAELARARQAAKQTPPQQAPAPSAAAAVPTAAPVVAATVAPVVTAAAPVVAAATAAARKAPAPAVDAVSNMLRSSHATRARESSKPRTSLPKPGKVENLRTFWKEKAANK